MSVRDDVESHSYVVAEFFFKRSFYFVIARGADFHIHVSMTPVTEAQKVKSELEIFLRSE